MAGRGGTGLAPASGSLRTDFQYSAGIVSPGPSAGVLRGSLPTVAASFSICFGVGHAPSCGAIGHSTSRTYQEQASRVGRWSKARKMILGTVVGCRNQG